MKTWPTAFNTEKNKAVGAKPVWILRLTINSVSYYLTAAPITIPSFATSLVWPQALEVVATPQVKSWGSIQTGINGYLDEFQVSEFSMSLINDPQGVDFSGLLTSYAVEGNAVELYLWFRGLTEPPERIFQGYVRDISDLTDTEVSLTFQDATIKLEKHYLGTKVSKTNFANANSQEVGKVLPITFGTVVKAPAILVAGGIVTTLKTACTAAATSITLSDVTGIIVGTILLIDSEELNVTAVASPNVTVTRGYNSTTAAAHTVGTTIALFADHDYILSDNSLTSATKAWLKLSDELFFDASAYTTLYTGATGSQLAPYNTRAVGRITAANFKSLMAAISLAVSDTIDVTASKLQLNEDSVSTMPRSASGSVGTGGAKHIDASFNNTESTNRASVFYTVSCEFECSATYDSRIFLMNASATNLVETVWSENGVSGDTKMTFTFDAQTAAGKLSNIVRVETQSDNVIVSARINSCSRVITQIASSTTGGASVAKTGGVAVSGSNIANYLGPGKFYWNGVSPTNTITEVCDYILTDAGQPTPITTAGTIPTYEVNGVITEYKTALSWLNLFAFQWQSWFAVKNGKSYIIGRAVGASLKTISACKIENDGVRTLSRKKTEIGDVLNKIEVLYNLDYSISKGDEAYSDSTLAEDTASQAIYGLSEQPDMFKSDFITTSAGAISLRDFYSASNANRRWLATFSLFLDNAELEFGDIVTLGFLNNTVGTVLNASHSPGSSGNIDTIELTVLI